MTKDNDNQASAESITAGTIKDWMSLAKDFKKICSILSKDGEDIEHTVRRLNLARDIRKSSRFVAWLAEKRDIDSTAIHEFIQCPTPRKVDSAAIVVHRLADKLIGPEGILPPAKTKSKPRMSKKEANLIARELLQSNPDFAHQTAEQWADAIGCGLGQVPKLPAWMSVMEKTGRGRKNKGAGQPKRPVSLTSKLEASVDSQGKVGRRISTSSSGHEDELQSLIAEQKKDFEPSPLEDDDPAEKPRRVKAHKRL